MATYTHTLSVSLGGDPPSWEGEATVSYTVTWGAPERGPSYSHGGLPAVPDEVADVTVTHIDGDPVGQRRYGGHEAQTIACHIECNDALMGELLTHAYEQDAEAHAEAMEYRAEVRGE